MALRVALSDHTLAPAFKGRPEHLDLYRIDEAGERHAFAMFSPGVTAAERRQFAAAPVLLTALREVRGFVAAELDVRFRSYCVCDPITGEPDPSTLDDEGECAEAQQALAIIDAAIAEATQP